ncbi:hypothetical protein E2C01_090553 [Portunus trituberculatus]|uniref:Uncharacterized protein n=1 Tax=Portunus trituberculatus TaxID=210409 RepID=A0A5B7JM29_PORTR|nr:hypothetical protein [Portunus trituberculatus]
MHLHLPSRTQWLHHLSTSSLTTPGPESMSVFRRKWERNEKVAWLCVMKAAKKGSDKNGSKKRYLGDNSDDMDEKRS